MSVKVKLNRNPIQVYSDKFMKPVYFTPGPSELFYTVPDHLKKGLREHIFSINHRSSRFREIVAETKSNLTELFQLPDGYRMAFVSSASEVWERIVLNLVEENAGFIVNGYFSERFANIAEQWGRNTERYDVNHGTCADIDKIQFSDGVEVIGITHNETSTGATHPLDEIYKLRDKYPDSLIAVDIVSSAPVYDIDFDKIDTAYFSVQKGFGLPAGLGVWIYNQRCLDKTLEMEKRGVMTGSYHKLSRLTEQIDHDQTASTPNMMGIYLLGKVAGDMLEKGIDMIRRESRYKAALTYEAFEKNPHMDTFVKEQNYRSQTTMVASLEKSKEWIAQLEGKGIIVGNGYGLYKELQIRIANFPTHSKEQFERLSDELLKLD